MSMTQHAAGRRLLAVLAGGAAIMLPAVVAMTAAKASLTPGTGWTAVTLPANYAIANGSNGPALSPVSCAPRGHFCVVIAADSAVKGPFGAVGQGDLVTSDAHTWRHYQGLPSSSMHVTAISCPTATVCYASGPGPQQQPRVAETVNGGVSWKRLDPPGWGTAFSWWPNSIDCVSATTCWVAGVTAGSTPSPVIAETTDQGTTWTTFSNLPSSPGGGGYQLNGISCTTARICVAVGGLDQPGGTATVIVTTDGGVTWSRSIDATLSGIQQLFSVSCLRVGGALPACRAAGQALQGAGPVELMSADGGATWKGVETADGSGRLNSISCPDAAHCWAAGAQTSLALLGTSDGGSSWSAETADTSTEDGSVSCASAQVCVATTDNALWVTLDGGGLAAAAAGAELGDPAAPQVTSPTLRLPEFSPATVWARSGRGVTVTGQYRGTTAATSASVTIAPPSGGPTTTTVPIGLNNYYSVRIPAVVTGTTTVTFSAGNAASRVVSVIGHSLAAPAIGGVLSDAGPLKGGNSVTVTGRGFGLIKAVEFGAVRGTGVKVLSTSKLTVHAPPGTGARYITVITALGGASVLTGRSIYNYLPAPSLTSISPRSGPAAGGTKVTITGANFAFVRSVFFGPNRASHLVVVSSSRIIVDSPAGTGTRDVFVRTAGGATRRHPADRFTY